VLAERGLLAAGAAHGAEPDGVFLLSGPPPFESVYPAFAERFSLVGPFSLETEA
jgi:hypothetical protein